MSSILIATDGSDAAASATDTGLEIASALEHDVIFVAVWEIIRTGLGAPFALVDQRYIDSDKKHAEEVLEVCRERAEHLGLKCETLLLEGDPATEICRTAAQRNVELIVVGAHGWGAMQGFVRGSALSGILQLAPCPVLTGAPGTREMLDVEALSAEKTMPDAR